MRRIESLNAIQGPKPKKGKAIVTVPAEDPVPTGRKKKQVRKAIVNKKLKKDSATIQVKKSNEYGEKEE